MTHSTSLLKFQIGPVQDFIAAARSTRDLWSGSYLLSWLVATGIRHLQAKQGRLVFPSAEGQPLLESSLPKNDKQLLIPNLPNLFIAEVTGDAKALALEVEQVIREEWQKIADTVWEKALRLGVKSSQREIYDRTVQQHLSISWLASTISESSYEENYRNNGWWLDAVRQTRSFDAWGTGTTRTKVEKDALTGKEEAILDLTGSDLSALPSEFRHLFKHHDPVGAITLIKRLWHLAYLRDNQGLTTAVKEFNIRSIPAIAARAAELDDAEQSQIPGNSHKYVAAIAFDGDQIGKWVSGEDLKLECLKTHHESFSKALSDFALKQARVSVEGDRLGQLIYAGGDDVVALVPSDQAIAIARTLRNAFVESTRGLKTTNHEGKEIAPDASAGIAIGHIHAPLQDLVREAQRAEKRAKNVVGRPAFSVTLMKRSGEISHWGSQWESGGIELYERLQKLMEQKQLSAKFPYRFIELLTPYLTNHHDLVHQEDAFSVQDKTQSQTTEMLHLEDLIHKEFEWTLSRQGPRLSKEAVQELQTLLSDYMERVVAKCAALSTKNAAPQELLQSLIGLCTTLAFAARTSDVTPTHEL